MGTRTGKYVQKADAHGPEAGQYPHTRGTRARAGYYVTMMYVVLTNSTSLREVVMGLEPAGGTGLPCAQMPGYAQHDNAI